jgi:hypothetical protein
MKTIALCSALALGTLTLAVLAGEPFVLTDGQMDKITAGTRPGDIFLSGGNPRVSSKSQGAAFQSDSGQETARNSIFFQRPGTDSVSSKFNPNPPH